MPPDLKHRAQRLRSEATDAERHLWQGMKGRQLAGAKFRRQHVLGPYVVDFVCLEQRLVVELDGGQHAENETYDDERTRWLQGQGYRVLRFWNNEVFEETEAVLRAILDALET